MRLIALSTAVIASTLATMSFAAPAEQLNFNIINLSAEANREISNDEMHGTLYIEKSNKQPAQLATDINQLMNTAITAAKKYPNVKIETGSQSTYPIYDNENRKLTEWRGRAQVRIKSTDFKAASQLIAELQQNFQTESINFTISDSKRKKVENELLIEASKNFQQRAQSLAQAWNKSGYQLISLNMNTNNYSNQPIPRMVMMKAASNDTAVTEQNVEAGESQLSISANGSIQLK